MCDLIALQRSARNRIERNAAEEIETGRRREGNENDKETKRNRLLDYSLNRSIHTKWTLQQPC